MLNFNDFFLGKYKHSEYEQNNRLCSTKNLMKNETVRIYLHLLFQMQSVATD